MYYNVYYKIRTNTLQYCLSSTTVFYKSRTQVAPVLPYILQNLYKHVAVLPYTTKLAQTRSSTTVYYKTFETSLKPVGNQSETSLKPHSETNLKPVGNQSETTLNQSETSRKPVGYQSETCRKPVGNQSETSRKPVGNQSETSWKPVGHQSETNRKPVGNQSETSRKPVLLLTNYLPVLLCTTNLA